MRTLPWPVLVVAVVFAASACVEEGNGYDGPTEENVVVKVTKADRDGSYVVLDSATVSNEEFSDGTRGYVTVSAKPASSEPDTNKTPLLSATVALKSGGSPVKCEMPRSFVWSSFTEYMELNLTCDAVLVLGDVESVTIVP